METMETMENNDDLALEALLAIRAEIAPDLDEELLRKCYDIQKKHQYARDRSHTARAMDRLIDERVNALVESSSEEGAS